MRRLRFLLLLATLPMLGCSTAAPEAAPPHTTYPFSALNIVHLIGGSCRTEGAQFYSPMYKARE